MADSPSRRRGEYAKTARRRQQIIAAAVDVFSDFGFQQGSLRDVAKRAGITHTGLMHHFPTKTDLLEAVLTWRDERQFEVGELPVGLAQVRGYVEMIELNQRAPELVRLYVLLSAEATTKDHPAYAYFEERYARALSVVRTSMEEAASTGLLRPDIDPASAARNLLAVSDGLQLQWLMTDGDFDMAHFVRLHLQSLLTVEI